MRKKFLALAFFFMASSTSLGGGRISGGGGDVGLLVGQVIRSVALHLENPTFAPTLYTPKQRAAMIRVADEFVKKNGRGSIFDSSKPLPVEIPASPGHERLFQLGVGFSTANLVDGETRYEMKIYGQGFSAISDPSRVEGLIHHELAILAELEKTGEYHYSLEFMQERARLYAKAGKNPLLCQLSLFDRRAGAPDLPGIHLGSTVIRVHHMGMSSGQVLLAKRGTKLKKDVAVRYVLSSEGYLRAAFDLVDWSDDGFPKNAQTESLSPEITFFNPYVWTEKHALSTNQIFDFGHVVVSCTRFTR